MGLKSSFVAVALAATVPLAGCASTGFTSTWRNPEAVPLEAKGARVAALVMTKNEATRRAAEDALAREITAQGAQGVPMYSIADAAGTDEAQTRAALEKQGFAAVVTMRPVGSQQQVTATTYAGPGYSGFWGGYYGYGWGAPYGGTEIRTDTIVSVETLIYSLKQNKLVWGGQSQTTNPSNIDNFVREVATAAAKELRNQGLIGPA
ncbi:MAG: hypothetical protein ABW292_11580 [Vicinamibacterales bacterium]